MGTDKQGRRSNVLGPSGQRLKANLKALRNQQGLSTRQLAERLTELGRPMQATAITKIEAGDRRVDVDDLVALAVALDVSPVTLLLPSADEVMYPGTDIMNVNKPVPLTENVSAPWEIAGRWFHGSDPLPESNRRQSDFIAENRPYENQLPDEISRMLSTRDTPKPWLITGYVAPNGQVDIRHYGASAAKDLAEAIEDGRVGRRSANDAAVEEWQRAAQAAQESDDPDGAAERP